MTVSLTGLRDVLDDLEIRSRINKDEKVILFNSEINDASIRFFLFVKEDMKIIEGCALLCDKKISDTNDFYDAYKFCNSWNSSHLSPKVYAAEEMQSLICNWKWDIELPYSNELLKDLVIIPFMCQCKEIFQEALDNNIYIN